MDRKTTYIHWEYSCIIQGVSYFNYVANSEKRIIMMKILIIHGQSHEGSTCMVARELANKVGGEISEFFLPRDS